MCHMTLPCRPLNPPSRDVCAALPPYARDLLSPSDIMVYAITKGYKQHSMGWLGSWVGPTVHTRVTKASIMEGHRARAHTHALNNANAM